MSQTNKWQKTLDALGDTTIKKTDSAVFKQYKASLAQIKREIKVYIETYDELSFSKRLEAERLLEIGTKIDNILMENTQKVTQIIKDGSKQQALNGYYGSFYGMEGANMINIPMSILGEDYIESLVNEPVNDVLFSQRLYRNTQELAQMTTQSLIQGAIDGKGYAYVAKRIEDMTESDYKRAMRIARTEGGRAQSKSTQMAYEDAQELGINLKKRWVASLDDRTRASHQELDGQTVNVDEDFTSSSGAKGQAPRLMGQASEDINCRCTTISIVDDYAPELRLDNETGQMVKNMTYNEWLDYKGVPKVTPKVSIKPAQLSPSTPPTPSRATRAHLQEMFEDDAIETIAQELGVSREEASKYYNNVLNYTGTDYTHLREYQRTGRGAVNKMSTMDEYLEGYIEKAPQWDGGEIYRGVSMSDAELRQLKVGTQINQGGTSSWSSDKDLAKYFSSHAKDDVRTNKIVYVLEKTDKATSITHISQYANEREVLVSKKSTQTITKIRKQTGTTYIHLSEGG